MLLGAREQLPALQESLGTTANKPVMNIAIFFAATLLISVSPAKKRCLERSDELYQIALRPAVSDSLLLVSRYLLDKLEGRCSENGIFVNRADHLVRVGSAATLYSRICRKAPQPAGAQAFVEYRREQWHSSDEDLALGLERVFVAQPSFVLSYVQQFSDTMRTQMLNDIVWGFINNRRYGPEGVEEESGEVHRDEYAALRREKLNQHTYRQIFMSLHPTMSTLLESYPRDINYMLNQAGSYFQSWGSTP